ncbi:PREDICTED: secretion-regulating guanine nucleotide exchange factor [Papilio polytes]|uniref:secretion-regulating guanine nucleotide exchange factor n=1 Tax=Papilio polytes TaxID=76194 RepID=UPI000675D4DC|nr:PREDICTED: secretion-regulating guanine nucleotide exchange factor [Papilio polytes]
MKLWSWGANSHGQLGAETISEQVEKPTKIVLPESCNNVKQISCGGGHTLLLDNEGKLYSCGWNLNKQLAINENLKESATFKRVWCLSGIKFTNITTGWDFSGAVSDDNFLFVWGSNNNGQLGLPKPQFSELQKPFRLQVNACSISMGLRHTAIVNSKGEVWVTGCGKHGQLGLGKDVLISDRFQKVLNVGKITHISCGQNHTVTWSSKENALYVWGDNKHGQLLLRCSQKLWLRNVYEPQKVEIGVKKKVRKLLSGWTNILLLLEDDTMLTWGRNNFYQLGTDEPFTGKLITLKLPGNRGVKDVALGSEHTICLAGDNTIWAWGWNEHANTGISLDPVIPSPTLVPFDYDGNEVIQIYAGGAHNFIVTQEKNYEE